MRNENGAEASVWVIAETHDFDTTFRKIVVTNDAGRFLVPDLPAASYEVWVPTTAWLTRHEHRPDPATTLT